LTKQDPFVGLQLRLGTKECSTNDKSSDHHESIPESPMTSRRTVAIAVAVAIVVTVVIAGFLFTRYPIFRAALNVSAYRASESWARNSMTDLPVCIAVVEYSVSNSGGAAAAKVDITVRMDQKIYLQKSIHALNPSGEYTDSLTVSVTYDRSSNVAIEAYCPDSHDSASVLLEAKLPRSFTLTYEQSIPKLYITPREGTVASTEDSVIRNKFLLLPNWMALRDWVGNNIDYRDDSTVHGKTEFWQLPKETLQLRTGDCEDFSILLCSLLRANGWSANDVYVVVGENDGSRHAWIKINLGLLGWYNIEPQANGWYTLIGDYLSLSGYTAIGYFNDLQFHWTG
jgi:hypothetical protein